MHRLTAFPSSRPDWSAPLFLLLLALLVLGLLLIPLGLPGLWVILLAVIGYGALTDFETIGVLTLVLLTGLAVLGELVEWWLGFRYAARYSGSRRAGWGALLGGLVGAFAGIPIPVLGSVIGSFLGAFAGAAIMEFTLAPDNAVRAGWGALLGRLWATAAKTSIGLVMVVVTMFAVVGG